jgi:hypothetical protein
MSGELHIDGTSSKQVKMKKYKPDIVSYVKFSIGNVSQVAGWAAILRGEFPVDEQLRPVGSINPGKVIPISEP